ncbi:MAG: hypothetical protein JNL33_05270 [Betaproteobacteria bacterium]|nr:hypothetical protein [Betaproteobacteria bacterium]
MNEDAAGRPGEEEDEEEVLLRADYLMRRHKGVGDPPGQPARSSPRDLDEIPLLTDLVSPGTRPLDTDPAQPSPVPPTPEQPGESSDPAPAPPLSGGVAPQHPQSPSPMSLPPLNEEAIATLKTRLEADISALLETRIRSELTLCLDRMLSEAFPVMRDQVRRIVKEALEEDRWARHDDPSQDA